MDTNEAMAALDAAYAGKTVPSGSGPAIGVFGNGLPSALAAAMGVRAVDVKMVPEAALSAQVCEVSPYVEPFVDDYARIFLHRLFAGEFDALDAIVFCRDDAAALVAYQYALELKRQGVADRPTPELLLWNFIHRDTEPARRFNLAQLDRLAVSVMQKVDGGALRASLDDAIGDEAFRSSALAAIEALRKADLPRLTGAEAFRWRNAGRYLSAREHGRLLSRARAGVEARNLVAPRRRFGVIGSALDSLPVYEMIERFGAIVTDLQPFGEVWPGPATGHTVAELLESEAGDAMCPRAEPAAAHRAAIVERCVADRCDIVIAQLDQNDDSVGWDLPSLRKALGDRGITLVDLGFRDHRPDAAWLAATADKLQAAMGEAA